jgi:hypothetical protein
VDDDRIALSRKIRNSGSEGRTTLNELAQRSSGLGSPGFEQEAPDSF